MKIEMNRYAAGYAGFLTYLSALTAVSVYGLYIGWYHALWVWVILLFTGFEYPDS